MTHVAWHKIAGDLAKRFHVVAADLRGYGDSTGPEVGGENHINYSFRPWRRTRSMSWRRSDSTSTGWPGTTEGRGGLKMPLVQ